MASSESTGQKALLAELHRRRLRLLVILRRHRYSKSKYYRRLSETGEPPADAVILIADDAGIDRREFLEVAGII
jgi:hypothetical protein